MKQWKPGDLVRLKSGGPTMTVNEVSKDARPDYTFVWVRWFDDAGTCYKDCLDPEALTDRIGDPE